MNSLDFMRRFSSADTPKEQNETLRQQLAAQVDKFLADGGRVTKVPVGLSGMPQGRMVSHMNRADAAKARIQEQRRLTARFERDNPLGA